MILRAAAVLACTALTGLALTGAAIALQPEAEAPAIEPVPQDESHSGAVMQLLASLEGQWRLEQEDGSLSEAFSAFKVSSAGSVVREIMAVGEPHEMTNLYHMDGDSVVCTHYCATGNQPRMIADGIEETDRGKSLDFKVDSVSNFTEGQDHYMGGLKLVFIDEDTVEQVWTTFNPDGEVAGQMTFVMKRDAEE
jgi:hypothetical protein